MVDIDREKMNVQLRRQFSENRNYHTLERYVMSELLSPIEDYANAIDIIQNNCDLCIELNLCYIAAYLCAELAMGTNDVLEKLNSVIDVVEDKDKAIIYYLNAYYLSSSIKKWRECEEYRFNLIKSIEYSKHINFVNNLVDLASISVGQEAQSFLKRALKNIEKVETKESLENKNMTYWLSSQRFIDEFILGTHLTHEVYMHKFGEIIE